MIIDLPDTTVSAISKALVSLREEGGAVTLGRVLTLVIMTQPEHEEAAIAAANQASHEHPMRVIALSEQRYGDGDRVHGEIRVGGDTGASEVIILRASGEAGRDPASLVTGLLLPDAPIVAWWTRKAPERVALTPVGRMATRRITDIRAHSASPRALQTLAKRSAPGDTDFAWTRITRWRSQLAAVLDEPPYEPVQRVRVMGSSDSPSAVLLAAWLGLQLEAPVELETRHTSRDGYGVDGVRLERASGAIELIRTSETAVRLTQPGQPEHEVAIPLRTDSECLAEELRRLDPDEMYERVLSEGLSLPRTVE